ncbi:MAG TPA: sigma-70 family RNA polymerase sigma factor [Candidatus Limnocylindria bacterium]|nr:sigma-70 family RNA polymerase sigma factor [Candidatus Limnocylindria bacterium]
MSRPDVDERIIAHLAFARAVASRSLDPRCRGADREDLIAWGVFGLVQAARRYRGDLGAPFGAYAARRVRGQVLDALRERDPLTRSERRAFREAQKVTEDLPPPYVEVSLDRLAELGDPDLRERGSVARRVDPRWSLVAGELRRLPPLERRVVVYAFARGMTLREIGGRVGLSESGVCRVRARALQKLRAACAARGDEEGGAAA